VPGASLIGDRYVCGPMCPTIGCHPALERWELRASAEASDIEVWWAEAPFSVLLATGHAFDVIDVPERIGRTAVREARIGPVAVSPEGRWLFFVAPGDGLRRELADQPDVVLHDRGSWIAAPPTRTPAGHVRWEVHPNVTRWRVPDPYAVQNLLKRQLPATGRAAVRPTSPAARAARHLRSVA
jgi:Bifunctional DNA primase/polymerase, N-terminal